MSRLDFEREFHNKRFSSDIDSRARISGFYVIESDAKDKFRKKLIKYGADKKILECGCARGDTCLMMAEYHGALAYGIDISNDAIEIAKDKSSKMNLNATFFAMDCEATQFDDHSFDLIFGEGILHHLDTNAVVKELARIVKPGGMVIFYEPLGYNPIVNLFRVFTPRMRTPDEHPYKLKDFRVIKNYFKTVEVEYSSLFSLLAIPFKRTSLFRYLIAMLKYIDSFVLKVPGIQMMAWTCTIVATLDTE